MLLDKNMISDSSGDGREMNGESIIKSNFYFIFFAFISSHSSIHTAVKASASRAGSYASEAGKLLYAGPK